MVRKSGTQLIKIVAFFLNCTVKKECKNLCAAFCFVPHFCSLPLDLCGKRRNTVLWCFLPNAPQFVAFFRLGFERATLSPGRCAYMYMVRFYVWYIHIHVCTLRCKKIKIFADFGAPLRIEAHLQVQHNCGEAIAVQHTRLKVQRGMLRCVLKCH